MIALMEAGVLDMGWGPDARLTSTDGGASVCLQSTAFEDNRSVRLEVLIDGRTNPLYSELVKRLILRRMARLAINRDASDSYELRTLEVTENGMIVNAAGEVDRRLFAMGQLAEGTVWYTQVAARPGVNSRALRDAGRWALTVRQLMDTPLS